MSDRVDPAAAGSRHGWTVVRRRGPATDLHALELPDQVVRAVWVLTPERPALVLGSTQPDDLASPEVLERRGIDLVRRRSGGGAVLLDPSGAVGADPTLWIDVILPRHDPLWSDDVGASMIWLGDAWVRALATFGIEGAVHAGGLERTAASTLVCFAGLGPGEVVVGPRKVVGISQRRTRGGARFQCLVHLAPGATATGGLVGSTAAAIVDLLDPLTDLDARATLAALLRDRTGVVAADPDAVVTALLEALPTRSVDAPS